MANAAVEMQKIAANAQIQAQKLSNEATEKSFKYNTAEANAARQWQTEMSNTSHQREVKDLIAAGLNPVLSSGGSGAQSYTTSSANAQAENAANAITQLATSRMSGLAGIEQANISAAATRSAAAQSAAAMKAAASAQAGAARYAASMQYLSQKYHSDKAYEAQKYNSQMQYKIAMNKPATNPFALADKYLTKTGISSSLIRSAKNIGAKFNVDMFNTPKAGSVITKNNFSLDKQGIAYANRGLSKLNLANTTANRNLYVKAFVFGDRNAMSSISNLVSAQRRKQQTALSRIQNLWRSSI